MQDQPNHPSGAEEENRYDAAVLALLLSPALNAPLSVGEVAREIGSETAAVDALARLDGAGLVHRCGDFVFATTAARRFHAIDQAPPAAGGGPREERATGRSTPRYYDELDESF